MKKNNFQFSIFKFQILLSIFIVFCYFVTRLFNFTLIPVFADEAIYIRWAQVMRAVPSLRFLPLSDGKQPFFMWLVIPFLKIIKDPLVAGRMVSVFSGFGTMVGIFVLSYLLFKKIRLCFLVSIFYLICPFCLFFDRMALVDGLLSFFFIWSFIFLILLIREIRLDWAMIAGILIGLGLITKSPALFLAILLPTTLIFFDFKQKKWPLHLGKVVVLWMVVWIFALAIYNILRLGPEFHMIAIRNKDYVFPVSEVLKHPLSPFLSNFKSVISWFWILGTPVVFIFGLLGMLVMLRKNFKEAALLLIWSFFPLAAQSAAAKVYTARYVLFLVPIFLIFAVYALEALLTLFKNRFLVIFIMIIILIFPVFENFLLLTNSQEAWLPENERKGYLEEWTSGYGIKESAVYLKKVAETQKVLVGTEGYFGTLPDGLQIYLEKVPNITVIGVGYPIKEIPEKLTNALVDNRVFLLVNDTRFEVKKTEKLNLIAKYSKAKNLKAGNQESLLFFEILKE